MNSIQHPFKVNADDLADRPRGQLLVHLLVNRVESIVLQCIPIQLGQNDMRKEYRMIDLRK